MVILRISLRLLTLNQIPFSFWVYLKKINLLPKYRMFASVQSEENTHLENRYFKIEKCNISQEYQEKTE